MSALCVLCKDVAFVVKEEINIANVTVHAAAMAVAGICQHFAKGDNAKKLCAQISREASALCSYIAKGLSPHSACAAISLCKKKTTMS